MEKKANKNPNVILINCDDLGYGDLGCYGSKINKSPYVDKLAENGLRFTSFYCGSPVCSPSRAALMSGCYPARVSINRVLFPGDPDGLNPEEFTMPRLFKNAGYSTMIVGKWHCGDQKELLPGNFGFDEYYGLPYSNDMGIHKKAKYVPLPLISNGEVIEEQPDQRGLTERYVEKSVDFIRRNNADGNNFFLYFAQMHIHVPLYAAERFVKESGNGDYGACMASLDWACGAIMYELEKLNILDNTIIIFTSDNGSMGRGDNGESNFPLRGGKITTWEGGQRIPFIIYWKDKIKPGVNNRMASQMDLLPTFAAILNQDLGVNKIDGVDLSGMIFSGGESPRNEFAYFRNGFRAGISVKMLEAVRKGNWKLHFYKDGEAVKLLYNLDADISESDNLYDSCPQTVSELTEIYDKYRNMLGDDVTGVKGCEVRECMFVDNPQPLTEYDPNHPYIVAMYDKG